MHLLVPGVLVSFVGCHTSFVFVLEGGLRNPTLEYNVNTNATDKGVKVDCMSKPTEASAKHFSTNNNSVETISHPLGTTNDLQLDTANDHQKTITRGIASCTVLEEAFRAATPEATNS